MEQLIEFSNVNYAYPLQNGETISAINHLNLKISEGERIAIIGANGSGKSTAAKLMNGLLHPNRGEVFIRKKKTTEKKHAAEIFATIGLLFQNPRDQIVASIVEEDVAFGPENLGLEYHKIHERVQTALRVSGSEHLCQRQAHLLSAGETQKVALAGVLAMQPACIIFDETTAMLDPRSRKEMLNLMQKLNRSGKTIIHITHDMDEALLADRILVFNQGRIVLDDHPEEIFRHERFLIEMNLNIPVLLQCAHDLQNIVPGVKSFYQNPQDFFADLGQLSDSPAKDSEIAQPINNAKAFIDIENLSFSYSKGTALEQPALSEISFTVPKGASMGLVGSTGSGKSTLLQHLNGIYRPQEGHVKVGSFNLVDPDLDVRALRKKAALVFQQPEEQFFETYVGDEIAYAARCLGYKGKLANAVKKAMEMVDLDFKTFKDRPLATLSNGQKRRVALASYIVVQPEIYLLDEPFAGLDPKTHERISGFIIGLHKQGKTILLSTHDMRDLCRINTMALLLRNGKNAYWGCIPGLFQILNKMTDDLQAPLEIQIADILRQKGYAIPQNALLWKDILKGINNKNI